ncbi:hypothetical protein E0Z06_13230 [Rheinheimera sp. D18]|uniref:hypothetical protein n=1 Tax=Rheinheimera sp. D18 TaxID=2545632 RepID=UPI0010489E4D|nr:hypothetical protein [Rheinheimera sp. D18]QBL10422.1 hypothetical protein E0Z06_13230 [Rheinheimera sp. D18]
MTSKKQNTKEEITFYYFLLDQLENSTRGVSVAALTSAYNTSFNANISASTTNKALKYLSDSGKSSLKISTAGEKVWFKGIKTTKHSGEIDIFLSYILKKFNPIILNRDAENHIHENINEYTSSIVNKQFKFSKKLNGTIKKLTELPRVSLKTGTQYSLNLTERVIKLNRCRTRALENSLISFCTNQIIYSQLKLIKIITEEENRELTSAWVKNSSSKHISNMVCGAFTISKILGNDAHPSEQALLLFREISIHLDASLSYDIELLNLIQIENLRNPLKKHCEELIYIFQKNIIAINKLRKDLGKKLNSEPEKIRLMLASIARSIAHITLNDFYWGKICQAEFSEEYLYFERFEANDLLEKMLKERVSANLNEYQANGLHSINLFNTLITNDLLFETDTYLDELSSLNITEIANDESWTLFEPYSAELVYKDEWSTIFGMEKELFLNFITTDNDNSESDKDRNQKAIERLSFLEEIIVTFGICRERVLLAAASDALSTSKKTITADLLRLTNVKKELISIEEIGGENYYISKTARRNTMLLLEMAKKFTPFKSFGPYQIFFQIYDDIAHKINATDREWLNKEVENSSDLPFIEKVWDLDFCLSVTPPDFVSMPNKANQKVTNGNAALLLHFDAMEASHLNGMFERWLSSRTEFEIGDEVIEVPLDPNFVDYTEGITLYYDGRLRDSWGASEDVKENFYINALLDSSPTSLLSMYFCPL